MTTTIEIRAVEAKDLDIFKEIRLESLREHPEVFAAVYEDEKSDPDEKWLERIANSDGRSNITFLAFVDHQPAGMTGIFRGFSKKNKHSGTIWGVYLRPRFRRQGLATALLQACEDWAKEKEMSVLKLNVLTTNSAAVGCYARFGFQVFGLESKALFVNGRYYDELLMAKDIGSLGTRGI